MTEITEVPITTPQLEEAPAEEVEAPKPVPPLKEVLKPKGRPMGSRDRAPRVIKKVKAETRTPYIPPRTKKQMLYDSWFES